MTGRDLGPPPTTENVDDLGVVEEWQRVVDLVGELVEESRPEEAAFQHLLNAKWSVERVASPPYGDFLAGFLRRRIVACDGHLYDAEAAMGGWNGTLRDARALCWAIAEELPKRRLELRTEVGRCGSCLDTVIVGNGPGSPIACPTCAANRE